MKGRRKNILIKIAVLSAVVLAGTLSGGCGQKAGTEKVREKGPEMTASNGVDSITIAHDCGTWSYRMKGEEWGGYCADCPHPLMWDYEALGRVLENRDGGFRISFGEKPDSVSIMMWPRSALGNEDQGDSQKLEYTEAEDGYAFSLPDENGAVCVIYAEWEKEDYHGDGTYGFLVMPGTD